MKPLYEAFEVVEEGDKPADATDCSLRCNDCGKEFVADFDLLKPKNVQYNLGEGSCRVCCPHCGNDGATDDKEVQIVHLRQILAEGEAKLQEAVKEAGLKFVITKQPDRSTPFRQAEFDCMPCGSSFVVRTYGHPEGQLNCRSDDATGSFVLVCPVCKVEDAIGPHNMRERANIIGMRRALDEVRARIVSLGGTPPPVPGEEPPYGQEAP